MARSGEITIRVKVVKEVAEDPEIVGVFSYHTDRFSRHPEKIRVSFKDGTTAMYDLRVEQPAPVILENIRIIRRMVGYEPKHAKKGAAK